MKDRAYRIETFAFYDQTAIQKRVEMMAARGWLLDKPGNFLWRYRRIEPQTLRAAVTYFPTASAFDPGPSQGELTMEEFCARDGWTLLARWGQMQIFASAAPDPTPIDTDPVTQVETIHLAMKRAMLPGHLLLAAVMVWQLCFQFFQFRDDPIDFLTDSATLLMLPMWMLLLTAVLLEMGIYLRWHREAARAAEDGVFLPIATRRRASVLLLGGALLLLFLSALSSRSYLGTLLVWGLLYAGILLLATRLRDAMKRRGSPRWATRLAVAGMAGVLSFAALWGVVTAIIRGQLWQDRQPPESYQFQGHAFSVYHDPLPLTVADLGHPGGVRYSTEARREETFLLARSSYRQDRLLGQDPLAPELDYTVVEVKAPFLAALCREAMLEEDPVFEAEYRPADPAPWGASEAWRLYRRGEPDDRYLLAWPDRLAEVQVYGMELDGARMGIIGEKLKG